MAKGRAFAKPLQAKRTEYAGIEYDSKAEAQRAEVLDGLRRGGLVRAVFRQVKCDVGEPGVDKPYRVDFLVLTNREDGYVDVHAEDVKGADSPTFRRHVKQWERRGCVPLHTIRRRKHEATTPGGRAFPPVVVEGTTVDGIAHRNKTAAAVARQLAEGVRFGSVAAFWRDVIVDEIPGRPGFRVDFLAAHASTRDGLDVEAVVVTHEDPHPILAAWRRAGVRVPLRILHKCGGDVHPAVYTS